MLTDLVRGCLAAAGFIIVAIVISVMYNSFKFAHEQRKENREIKKWDNFVAKIEEFRNEFS
jgi:uncharacterized membrane protein YciS (DUF1049 family)